MFGAVVIATLHALYSGGKGDAILLEPWKLHLNRDGPELTI